MFKTINYIVVPSCHVRKKEAHKKCGKCKKIHYYNPNVKNKIGLDTKIRATRESLLQIPVGLTWKVFHFFPAFGGTIRNGNSTKITLFYFDTAFGNGIFFLACCAFIFCNVNRTILAK